MLQSAPYRFCITPSGRRGTILCSDGKRSLTIDWEMSGVTQYDILLAPIDISAWGYGEKIPRDQQMEILFALRAWFQSQNIKSDIVRTAEETVADTKCIWSGCQSSFLSGAAYCAKHWDESLLR